MSTTLRSKFAAFLRPDRVASLVSDGRVSCPYGLGDVDVDRCFGCPSYEGTFEGKAGGTWLRCRATLHRPLYRA